MLRTIALAATVAAITYLFLPTGATGIQHGTAAFEVNLRYVTPALALCLLLLGPVVAIRAPQLLGAVGPGLAVTALLAQFEHNLWPTDPARHIAFLAISAVLVAGTVVGRRWLDTARRAGGHRSTAARHRTALAGATVVAALAVAAAGDVAQRHYLNRRYLVGAPASAGLGAIYRWAQSVAHARIALYGTVEQYPLYGATDTNLVHYLGQPAPNGGYEPITTCRRWQSTLQDGAYRYLVLTRGPTAAIPPAWSQDDASLTPILHPTADEWVFRVTPGRHPVHC